MKTKDLIPLLAFWILLTKSKMYQTVLLYCSKASSLKTTATLSWTCKQSKNKNACITVEPDFWN